MSTDTGQRLLQALKTRGPQAAASLAAACAITPMGAHKQLQALLAQGLVQAQDQAGGIGRPKRIWSLSAAGHGRFPDGHGDLAMQLISLLDESALERLIGAREAQMRSQYLERVSGCKTLGGKLRALAGIRSEEGYMARVEREAQAWLLIEDHCPICAAATRCQGFCRSELDLFRLVLGLDVDVQRSEHTVAGGRRCAYRITRHKS